MESGTDYRQDLGRKGEDIACEFLIGKGHTVLARNYRSGHLEIDIITFDSEGIHFVEVKTRRKNIQAPPQENVGSIKQNRIVRAAKSFLNSRMGVPYGNHECMFDVVAITFDGDSASLEWFPQAYIPMYL